MDPEITRRSLRIDAEPATTKKPRVKCNRLPPSKCGATSVSQIAISTARLALLSGQVWNTTAEDPGAASWLDDAERCVSWALVNANAPDSDYETA